MRRTAVLAAVDTLLEVLSSFHRVAVAGARPAGVPPPALHPGVDICCQAPAARCELAIMYIVGASFKRNANGVRTVLFPCSQSPISSTTRSNTLEIVLIRACLYGPDASKVFTLKTLDGFTIERR